MSGKSTSVSSIFEVSTPFFSSDSFAVTSATFLSVFTASVLPSRSLGSRMSLSLATMIPEKSSSSLFRTKVPGATIFTGIFLLWREQHGDEVRPADVDAAGDDRRHDRRPALTGLDLDGELAVLEEALLNAVLEEGRRHARRVLDAHLGRLAGGGTAAVVVTAGGELRVQRCRRLAVAATPLRIQIAYRLPRYVKRIWAGSYSPSTRWATANAELAAGTPQ